ncbi:MAG TPA: signal peptidase II [Chlamydiales bacterium]|nr:signal peptidase II [Chlamydiales bacterium]
MSKRLFFLFVFLLGLDIASKILALEYIPWLSGRFYPFGGIGIFSGLFGGITFSLNTIVNSGAAWGVFAGHSGLLFGIRAAIIFGLVLYLLVFHRGQTAKFPLWLIVTGAAGNAIDYWRYGHVIDFLHFTFWGYEFPIFNLADSYISIGVMILFLLSRFSKKELQTS